MTADWQKDPGAFTADWFRRRFLETEQGIRPAEEGAPAQLIPAAVLVAVVNRAPHATVLFTQRTAHLHDHPGQVSFPGGRCEDEDASPIFTALREAHEEIGLPPSEVDVIGCLPDYRTSTGFVITPVVGIVEPPLELRPDTFEVAEVFEAPLYFLLDPRNHQRHSSESGGRLRQYYAMPYEGHYIWGATAGMVVSLYGRLLGQR